MSINIRTYRTKSMAVLISALLVFALLPLSSAFGAKAPDCSCSNTYPQATLEFMEEEVPTLLVGEKDTLWLEGYDVKLKDLTITSSNPKAIKIVKTYETKEGIKQKSFDIVLKCVGEGTSTIRVTDKRDSSLSTLINVKGTSKVRILQADSNSTTTVKPGQTIKMQSIAYGNYYSHGIKPKTGVTYKSSNKKLATVNKKTGQVKVKKNAKADKSFTITATYKGKKSSTKFKVVKGNGKVKSVSIYASNISPLFVGEAAYPTYEVTPKDKKKPVAAKYKFKSSNSKVLSVDSFGRLVAKKKGKAKITVSIGGKKASKWITVK